MPSKAPLISVIIPAYQSAQALGRTLESVLRQGYPELEIIIVDDGSTDATAQVVAQAAARDPRIRYQWQTNQGQAVARTVGARQSIGEYLAFIDADDEWRPGKLQLQADILSQLDSVGFVFTNSLDVDAATGKTRLLSERQAEAMRTFIQAPLPQHADTFAVSAPALRLAVFRFGLILLSSVMLRRALFEQLGGFDPRRRGTDDVDLYVRATRLAGFAYCAQPLAIHNLHGHNMSGASERWYKEIINHLRLALASPDYADLRVQARQRLRVHFRWLIFYYGRHRQPRQAWAAFRASQEAGFDGLSALCALGAWFGPLPFMAIGRLLWP